MLGWIAKTYLKNKIASDRKVQKKHFVGWDKVERIALILDKKDNINKSEIDKLLENTKKFIDVYYIDLSSKTPAYSDWNCFSKQDKSLLGLPKGSVLDKLKQKKFDLVINATDAGHLYAAALATSLSSAFKCSQDLNYNIADLIIHKLPSDNTSKYLNTVFNYLKMIRV